MLATKNFIFAMAAAILFVIAPAQLNADIIGLWQFEHANVGLDSSGRGNELTAYGNSVQTTGGQGRHGEGLFMDESNGAAWLGIAGDSHLDTAFTQGTDLHGIPLGNASYTIAAWIRPDIGGGGGAILGWGTRSQYQTNVFRMNTEQGLWNYWWGPDFGTNSALGGGTFTDGIWRHVAVTYDATAANRPRSMYVDGNLIAFDQFDAPANLQATNFRIGQHNPQSTGFVSGGQFLGSMDDIALFDEALTPAQLTTIATGDFSAFGVNAATAAVPEPGTYAVAFLICGAAVIRRNLRRNVETT